MKTEGGEGGEGEGQGGGAVTNDQGLKVSSSDSSPHNGVLSLIIHPPSLPTYHYSSYNGELRGNQTSLTMTTGQQPTGTMATEATGIGKEGGVGHSATLKQIRERGNLSFFL